MCLCLTQEFIHAHVCQSLLSKLNGVQEATLVAGYQSLRIHHDSAPPGAYLRKDAK